MDLYWWMGMADTVVKRCSSGWWLCSTGESEAQRCVSRRPASEPNVKEREAKIRERGCRGGGRGVSESGAATVYCPTINGARSTGLTCLVADSNPAVKGRMRRKTVVHPRARLPMVHPTDADSPNLISPILPKTTGTKHWNKQRRARASRSDFENECAGPSFGLISVNFVYEVCARFAVAAFRRLPRRRR